MKTKQELEQEGLVLQRVVFDAEAEYKRAIKVKRRAQSDAAAALTAAARAKIQYMRVMGAIEESEGEDQFDHGEPS